MSETARAKAVNHNNYLKAFQLAQEKLRAINFVDQCQKAGARMIETKRPGQLAAALKFLDQEYVVEYPEAVVRLADSDAEPLPYDRILILHYLIHAQGAELSGELVSYQQIPDGWLYYPKFRERTVYVLARSFSGDAEGFVKAGLKIGGHQSSLGQYAVEFFALPKVAVHLIMWPGDDELDTEFSFVFDRSVTSCLPAEDITVLAGVIASRMARHSGKGQNK